MNSRSDATRAKIEDAAIRLFAEQGIQQTSTRDLAAGAGVAEGSLYRHFPSKDEMVKVLFDKHYSVLAERWDTLAGRESCPREKLSVILRDVCRLYDEAPERFRFLLLTQHQALPYSGQGRKTPVSVLYGIISEGVGAGVFRKSDPNLMTAFIMGLITQPPVFMIYGRLETSMSSIMEDLVETALACLGSNCGDRSGGP
ncbi:TetR/AcrR family transcriptional regulator [Pelagibius sp. Alg239-R121]|uniref:TetR/AcrR family transcriptional regulator n=1 Tax=Pelagibius sp. Alg239-R121 TaxID=2993448 RepID=UPI0024A71F63|nr:TetR/AcrR family transcriptional regulator [Pelagibius sp. Alg239-R121]